MAIAAQCPHGVYQIRENPSDYLVGIMPAVGIVVEFQPDCAFTLGAFVIFSDAAGHAPAGGFQVEAVN